MAGGVSSWNAAIPNAAGHHLNQRLSFPDQGRRLLRLYPQARSGRVLAANTPARRPPSEGLVFLGLPPCKPVFRKIPAVADEPRRGPLKVPHQDIH
jgi:hypothetical protein